MDILAQLFRGKINPTDWTPESEEYRRRLKKSGDIGHALSADLTEAQNKLLDQYMDARLDMEILVHEDLFRRAFLLGVQMQKAVTIISEQEEAKYNKD